MVNTREVAEGVVRYLAWAQNERGRGGWRYTPNTGDSDNQVAASNHSVVSGDTPTATVSVDQAAGIAAGSVEMEYDPALLTVLDARATALVDSLSPTTDTGVAGVVGLSLSGGTALAGGSGALLEIDFEAKTGVAHPRREGRSHPGPESGLSFSGLVPFQNGRCLFRKSKAPLTLASELSRIGSNPVQKTASGKPSCEVESVLILAFWFAVSCYV